MAIQGLVGNTIRDKIKGSSKLILLDFYADWCGPCKQISPILEELDRDSGGQYEIHKVDVDNEENRDFIVENLIMSIPTVVFYKNGEKVFHFVGLQDKESIKEMISQHSK